MQKNTWECFVHTSHFSGSSHYTDCVDNMSYQVEFVDYGPKLIGISLMVPTAPALLACGLAADDFERKHREG